MFSSAGRLNRSGLSRFSLLLSGVAPGCGVPAARSHAGQQWLNGAAARRVGSG
ncbi:hypothetical protein [Hymenobacter wooponensis]|uniref:hypothetical protein n=1 Tax=Hymenobacter wooponensis TaxID=1525360 RepID=UPI001436A819|nr:hypothetical protein [Hymenobacter wooponensis]